MAYLVVNKNGDELAFLGKPEKIKHSSIYNKNIIDFEGWSRGGDTFKLNKGTIEKITGKKITWDDEPLEISIEVWHKLKSYKYQP